MNALLRGFLRVISARGRLLQRFSKKIGLVYFGGVDQHQDDHDVIRGLTVSTSHQDTHYAVGTYDGYDISMVDRFDIVSSRDGKKTENTWLIMRIDLETQQTLPHLFLRPLGHTPDAYNKFFDAFHHLQPVNAMMLGGHTPEFHGRYEIYTMASRALEIEEYFTAEVTQIIGACFWPHAIELLDNKLYIYTTNPTLTDSLLNTALESGLWLARILDKQQD